MPLANKLPPQNHHSYLFFVISLFLYSLAMVITKLDINFTYRWVTFCLWIFSIFTIIGFFFIRKFNQTKFSAKLLNQNDFALLSIVIFLALTTRFLFLKTYPFVAIFDEVRDGGLNAWEILNGSIKNIHGYGRYEAHGLIIPTLTSYFYLIFKNSVFTYRLPAALIAILDIFVIFSLSKKIFNSRIAFLTSLIVICSPLHLFYSRTEVVVITSSLFASLILFWLYSFLKNKNKQEAIFLGLTLGFSLGLHADVKAFALWTLIILFFLAIFKLTAEKEKTKTISNFILIIVFLFVGFGPRALFTTPKILFHTSRIPLLRSRNKTIINLNLTQNYLSSLAVYFKQPISYLYPNYPNKKPLLSPLLFTLFVIGLIKILISPKKTFLKILGLYTIFIPLTNSALTDSLNLGNRLITLLPVCALIISVGINWFSRKIKLIFQNQKIVLPILASILVCSLCLQAYEFFNKESASKLNAPQEYLSMYAVYSLKRIPPKKDLCFIVSPQNYKLFKLLHFKEQRQFFLPQVKNQKVGQNKKVSKNQIFISKTCHLTTAETFLNHRYCQHSQKFVCPLKNHQPFEIFVEKSLMQKI